jgi:hypothetical protein
LGRARVPGRQRRRRQAGAGACARARQALRGGANATAPLRTRLQPLPRRHAADAARGAAAGCVLVLRARRAAELRAGPSHRREGTPGEAQAVSAARNARHQDARRWSAGCDAPLRTVQTEPHAPSQAWQLKAGWHAASR